MNKGGFTDVTRGDEMNKLPLWSTIRRRRGRTRATRFGAASTTRNVGGFGRWRWWGRGNGRFWANPYRLDHILPDDLELLGTFVPRLQQRPLLQIRYKLSPRIVRGGISRYFADLSVSEPHEAGWVKVAAYTDNKFEAFRILLAYADQCVVLSPSNLVERLRQVAQSFSLFYGETSLSLPVNETE
jgi:hypothetical protein